MTVATPKAAAGWVAPWLVAVLLACGGGGSTLAPADEAAIPEGASPQRIIAIAPSVTEMLFELGLGDSVVGVGDYAMWPPEVVGLPRLGGLFDARLETIAGLDPDLAILLPSEERLRMDLDAMGVEVLTVPSNSIDDVEIMAALIGERCNAKDSVDLFRERWREQLAPRSRTDAPRVLLTVNREPGRLADVLVAGPGTFLDELLQRLGVENVLADAQLAYPQVGLEEVILRHPQVVIELQATPGDYAELSSEWTMIGSRAALIGTCVRIIAGHHVLIPGPRLPRLMKELEEAVASCVDQQ